MKGNTYLMKEPNTYGLRILGIDTFGRKGSFQKTTYCSSWRSNSGGVVFSEEHLFSLNLNYCERNRLLLNQYPNGLKKTIRFRFWGSVPCDENVIELPYLKILHEPNLKKKFGRFI